MCLFCDIIQKRLPAEIIYENDQALAINDIHPKAPVHVLIMPKVHIESVKDITNEQKTLLAEIINIAIIIAKQKSLNGYKLIFNVGREGGQIIDHLHLHMLGGWFDKPQKIEV